MMSACAPLVPVFAAGPRSAAAFAQGKPVALFIVPFPPARCPTSWRALAPPLAGGRSARRSSIENKPARSFHQKK